MSKKTKERNVVKYSDNMNVMSFLKILVVILVVLTLFTLITMYATRNKNDNKKAEVVQYTKIIVGSILNRPEEKYYVLVEKENDADIATYEQLINSYNKKEDSLRVYTVDLADAFNQPYVSDKASLEVSKIEDIKFNDTVLLEIKDGKIYKAILKENINTYLTNLSA